MYTKHDMPQVLSHTFNQKGIVRTLDTVGSWTAGHPCCLDPLKVCPQAPQYLTVSKRKLYGARGKRLHALLNRLG